MNGPADGSRERCARSTMSDTSIAISISYRYSQ